jgi:hypothetical protein
MLFQWLKVGVRDWRREPSWENKTDKLAYVLEQMEDRPELANHVRELVMLLKSEIIRNQEYVGLYQLDHTFCGTTGLTIQDNRGSGEIEEMSLVFANILGSLKLKHLSLKGKTTWQWSVASMQPQMANLALTSLFLETHGENTVIILEGLALSSSAQTLENPTQRFLRPASTKHAARSLPYLTGSANLKSSASA